MKFPITKQGVVLPVLNFLFHFTILLSSQKHGGIKSYKGMSFSQINELQILPFDIFQTENTRLFKAIICHNNYNFGSNDLDSL